jgi:ligand-binding sensor domain-containing protein/two-component sensor histidine kinase
MFYTRPTYMQKLFFFLLVIFIHHPASAQYDEKDFVRYTVKDGLSDNYITCLQQDYRGYIWAGTDIGLNRFDGNSFKNFYQGNTSLPLLSGNIRELKLFENNRLGIISRGGFQLLNTNNFSLQNYFIPDSTAFTTQLNAAWDAVQLSNQSFAVTTASGFYVFNKPGEVVFRYDAYSLKDIGKKRIFYGRDILSINDKELAVYTDEAGLAYYNAEKKLFRNINPNEYDPIAIGWKIFSHPVNTVDEKLVTKYPLSKHEFIFTFHLKDSIVFYNHALKKAVTSPLPFRSSVELSWESKIEMLNDSAFAINGGSYGFYIMHLNRQTGRITCDGKKFLSSYKITGLFLDKDKRLWAGTSEGLLQQKLNPSFVSSYHFGPAPGDVLTGGFMSAYSYKDKLYAGRYSLNKGLVILNKSTMQLEKQIDFYGGNNGWNEILSMEMYHADTLWLGTNAGLLWFDTKTNHYGKVFDEKKYPRSSGMSVILSPANKDGYAWMCGELQGLVVRYHIASRKFTLFTSTTQPALPFDRVKSIVYDSYGDVWIGGHSLARFNTKLQAFDTLLTVYGGANKFNDDILTLSADNNGSLWLHNANNGLLEYRIKEKRFEAYTMKDGLPSDVLTSFSPIIDNTLWLGSNNHLSEFDTRTKKVIVYDQQDGLPEHKPSGRRIYYDLENNLLYLCSGEYITKIPAQQYQTADYSSNLLLQELIVNNKKSFFNAADEIQLKYSENNLLLNYTIVDFEKSNYQFAYKINNAENWNDLGSQRNLNLNNLQPGKYLIQLKATGKSGNEKIKEFALVIQSPFWKTVWFLTVCGLLLAWLLYYLYRSRIKQVRQKADIDKLLAQTEMKALHAQMNPHFIFNSLNSIREMILSNENKEASHFLGKFAQLIRITLNQSGESFISLRNTIDYLHRYIEMEQIRNSYFTCRILADEELDQDETVLPPMLIQPFIENAIWHGTTGAIKNININIDFKKTTGSRVENNRLVCIIDDNGIGIEHSFKLKNSDDTMHNPVGIDNIKNRIRLLNEKYKLKCNLTIEDKTKLTGCTETGTLVTLQLPLEIADHE